MMTGAATRVDILIAGGGMTGLALAAALKQARPDLEIEVCDPALARPEPSGRAAAIAAGPRRMLEALGVWEDVAPLAQPILETIVTDSRTADVVRPRWLTFDGRLEAEGDEPVATMVMNADVSSALRAACGRLDITMQALAVTRIEPGAFGVAAHLADGRVLRAGLLVIADGARSALRTQTGIDVVGWDYGQSGIVATIGHERDHEGRAYEHFLPAGPFAILPLRKQPEDKRFRSSIVWNETHRDAQTIVSLPPEDFLHELETRFGHAHGALTVLEGPRAFPLGFHIARRTIAPRLVLIGDAAHLIHPIAGQGLNLGLRDAAALAQALIEALRQGLDPGSLAALEPYEQARRFDTWRMQVTSDVLNRLFANDVLALRLARDLGLGLVDRLPGLKRRFAAEAAGIGASGARLLRGEAI